MTHPPTPTTQAAKPSKKKLAAAPDNPFVEFVKLYKNNPVLFVREVLNTEPDVWQIEFLNHIAAGNRRISVRSGHGVGKSTASAWAMLWYLFLRFDQLEVKQDRIEMKSANNEAFISARTSRAEQPEALQGVHSDNVMLVADEASGIPEQVFEAAAGSMSGHAAVTLLLGNPVRSSGFFFDTHNRLTADWITMKVSCADSPRVSEAYIEEMKARYGEESNAYRIRVLGEFPRSDDDTVIPMELLELATQRDVEASKHAPLVWGLDVARFGSDRSALCKRQGNAVVEPIKTWKNLDLMQLTGAVVAEFEILVPSQRPQEILVDSIGLGAGVVDRLKELGLPARGINVAESPAMGGTYRNLKAELWHKAKAWLEQRDCRMPKDEALIAELAAVRYSFTSSGKIQIEGKDELKKRGMASPDRADAFCLTFASDAVIGMYGSAASTKWNQPLRRNLPRVA
jgi:hypothetical protein